MVLQAVGKVLRRNWKPSSPLFPPNPPQPAKGL